MARIKIKDLPEDQKISRAEMKQVTGGTSRFTNIPINIGEYSSTTDEFGLTKTGDTDPIIQPLATPDSSSLLDPGDSRRG